MGYVIQQTGLFPHQTIATNVGTVPRLLGWKKERIAARVDELLELVGLPPDVYREAGTRRRCRAASASVSAWRGRSPPIPPSSSWTSRSAPSIP